MKRERGKGKLLSGRAVNLTPKQARFAQEYLVDLCGKASAIRAGYSPRTACAKASALLRHPKVATIIQEAKDARSKATGIAADRVLEEIAAVAFADMKNVIDRKGGVTRLKAFEDMPDGTSRALDFVSESRGPSGDRVMVKLYDKLRALSMLAAHLGICKEQVNVSGQVDTELTIKVVKV